MHEWSGDGLQRQAEVLIAAFCCELRPELLANYTMHRSVGILGYHVA